MKVSLKVPLSPYLGYGNDGIGIARALDDYGVDVHIAPGCITDSPIPQQVANLLTRPKLDHYDLTIHHLDPDNLNATDLGLKTSSGLLVGWSMWEYSNFKNAAGVKSLRKRLAPFDVLLAYDEVTAGAFREYYDGEIRILQGGYLPDDYPFIERNWFDPDHFRFCMLGQLHERKDPFVSIQAFLELKEEHPQEFAGAELHLKTNIPGLPKIMNEVYKEKKIRVYSELWGKDVLDKFYSQMHCLLAPSRGEGKNMPALEFQTTGGVVIATGWGGHTQWLNSQYNYAIDYTLAPVDNNNLETLNARADVNHLKELMLHVYRNRAESKRKGELASQIIPQAHSWEAVTRGLFRVLGDIDPKLASLASIARTEAQRDTD